MQALRDLLFFVVVGGIPPVIMYAGKHAEVIEKITKKIKRLLTITNVCGAINLENKYLKGSVEQ